MDGYDDDFDDQPTIRLTGSVHDLQVVHDWDEGTGSAVLQRDESDLSSEWDDAPVVSFVRDRDDDGNDYELDLSAERIAELGSSANWRDLWTSDYADHDDNLATA